MKRREFIAFAGGAAVAPSFLWPLAAHAQATGRVRKVGVLLSGVESDPDSQVRIAAFRRGVADLGWKEGLGHVQSLSRPGGNITGFTFIDPALIGKWIGYLKEIIPNTGRAGLLFNPGTTPFYPGWIREIEAAHLNGTTELVAMPVGSDAAMEAAIAALAQKPGSCLMIGPDPFNVVRIKAIAQLAAQNRLPAISVYRPFAVEGGLMAYGPDTADIFRRSAGYVDRILKGASPADLPVQQPDKFEFVINLKAAKALGLTVPATQLATADEVIE